MQHLVLPVRQRTLRRASLHVIKLYSVYTQVCEGGTGKTKVLLKCGPVD